MRALEALCLWALAALVCVAQAAPAGPGFDLFLLVRSYSPGFCQESNCSIDPVSAFTLHGLWPEYEKGGYPEFCKSTSPPGGPLPTDAMRCEWESFMGANLAFWNHEWERHGTCAEPVLGNRAKFFSTVLELNQKYDVDAALSAKGITPSNKAPYSGLALRSAIRASYGASPVLKCTGAGAVQELWMCLDLDLQPRPCPAHIEGNCPARVHLPEGDPVPSSCSKYFPHSPKSNSTSEPCLACVGVAVLAAACVAAFLTFRCLRRRQEVTMQYVSLAC